MRKLAALTLALCMGGPAVASLQAGVFQIGSDGKPSQIFTNTWGGAADQTFMFTVCSISGEIDVAPGYGVPGGGPTVFHLSTKQCRSLRFKLKTDAGIFVSGAAGSRGSYSFERDG